MVKKLWAVFEDEEGQSMVEYGIIIALISVVSITVIKAIGDKILTAYTKVDNALGSNIGK